MKYLMLGMITEAGQQLDGPDLESWMAEIGAWYEKHGASGKLADAGHQHPGHDQRTRSPCQHGPLRRGQCRLLLFKLTVKRRSNDLERPLMVRNQLSDLGKWSGWRDSNPRPPAPKAGALTKLRHIPSGHRSLPRAGPDRAAGRYATRGGQAAARA